MANQQDIDRMTIRNRPPGTPIMYQSWRKLLFMHWQFPPELLRPLVPEQLEIYTFDGSAWIGVTPFVVKDARPAFLPPFPPVSDFEEVNVRTYVHYRGVPGVWFFSLDAGSALAVLGARIAYHLPYHTARMSFREENREIMYHSRRLRSPSQPAELEATWKIGAPLGEASPSTLEFFLVERYCLYALKKGELLRARIHHPPWKLQRAELTRLRSTMLVAQALPKPAGAPLLHYSEHQDTAIWAIRKALTVTASSDTSQADTIA